MSDTSDMPKCLRSKFWKILSVLGPKFPRYELSVHLTVSVIYTRDGKVCDEGHI